MCECLQDLEKRLAPQGLQLSPSVTSLTLGEKVEYIIALPLVQKSNGRKPKSGQPTCVAAAYCPFCGVKRD